MTTTRTQQLTDLQTRVMGGIDDEWADISVIAARVDWGGKGCRRSMWNLRLVMWGLLRKGMVEIDGLSAGSERVRRAGGAA